MKCPNCLLRLLLAKMHCVHGMSNRDEASPGDHELGNLNTASTHTSTQMTVFPQMYITSLMLNSLPSHKAFISKVGTSQNGHGSAYPSMFIKGKEWHLHLGHVVGG